jgi:hypothetical protein
MCNLYGQFLVLIPDLPLQAGAVIENRAGTITIAFPDASLKIKLLGEGQ